MRANLWHTLGMASTPFDRIGTVVDDVFADGVVYDAATGTWIEGN